MVPSIVEAAAVLARRVGDIRATNIHLSTGGYIFVEPRINFNLMETSIAIVVDPA